ncbi:multiple sugar transport system substrate-binding protein [Lentzea xinjiangensis]|uniref:Multiple sugar transport system substrate-binding protein n=1 Tax=Lentzea xinjiangensis TaxID=402600 RepID=A0A1H9WPX4_9PSEU|nr:multiple sugar transport system substrate-binding protein [Lentzea xinjiangensis]
MNVWTRRLAAASLAAVTAATAVTGCGAGGSASGNGVLKLWTHNAGNAAEYAAVEKLVNDFNGSQSTYKVEIEAFPQGSYNDAVVASSTSKKLPCLLDVDGPNVPNWAWAATWPRWSSPAGRSPWTISCPAPWAGIRTRFTPSASTTWR